MHSSLNPLSFWSSSAYFILQSFLIFWRFRPGVFLTWKIEQSLKWWMLGSEYLHPPKFIHWNHNPQGEGVRKWKLLEVISHKRRAFLNRISVLIKEATEKSFTSAPTLGYSEKVLSMHQKAGPYLVLDLGLPILQNCENTFLLFLSHLVMVFCYSSPNTTITSLPLI